MHSDSSRLVRKELPPNDPLLPIIDHLFRRKSFHLIKIEPVLKSHRVRSAWYPQYLLPLDPHSLFQITRYR